jgi:7-carboxy-7-deazaguanine synthase
MFGKNPIAKPRHDDFLVKNIWYTIQGEGPFAGLPATFVRFTGCNLRCFFCDTDFQGGTPYKMMELAKLLIERVIFNKCPLIVLTGGEPMLQDVFLLSYALNFLWLRTRQTPGSGVSTATHNDLMIQIETAGTVWPSWGILHDDLIDAILDHNVLIVCSPKTPKVHPRIEETTQHWKYIIRAGECDEEDGLPVMSTQAPDLPARIFRPEQIDAENIWVQACDEGDDVAASERNLKRAASLTMRFGYRLSVQLHKLVGVE